MESLAARTTAINGRIPVAAGSSPEAFQPLPPTVPTEEGAFDNAVAAAH